MESLQVQVWSCEHVDRHPFSVFALMPLIIVCSIAAFTNPLVQGRPGPTVTGCLPTQISSLNVSSAFAASNICIAELEASLQLVQAHNLHLCKLAVALHWHRCVSNRCCSHLVPEAFVCLKHLCAAIQRQCGPEWTQAILEGRPAPECKIIPNSTSGALGQPSGLCWSAISCVWSGISCVLFACHHDKKRVD